ncbi:MAG TPA: CvpA family protein, partial [bacterium]|nr:CvpA family protein [bacterium]
MGRTITVNWIDWITLAIILVAILRGTRYGVLAGVIDLAALGGAFLIASILYGHVVPGLHEALNLPN